MSSLDRAGRPQALSVSTWTIHLAALAGLIVVLGLLYARTVAAAVTVWWVSPTFSHCFLIIPVVAYLIWGKRRALARLTPVAYPRALLLALPVMAAAFVGALASINEIEQLALIAFVQVLALALLGPKIYRVILFPALYLFFLVPMGEYLIGPLQHFTTWFIDQGLTVLGILHFTEGNIVELANGRFQVAEACAGLRFLIATIAVGALFAHLTYRKWNKIALFMLACVIVPIIGNGFRALGIVLLAHFSDNRIAVGADHLVYGWGFSVAILAVLMFVGSKFADDFPSEPAVAPAPQPIRAHLLPLTVLLALLSVSAVPAFAAWHATGRPVDASAFAVVPEVQGFSTESVSRDWAPGFQAPDAKLEFAMRRANATEDGAAVDVFVDYYGGGGHNLISSANKFWDEDVWHPIAEKQATAKVGAVPVNFHELQIGSAGLTRLVWWTYVSGGSFTQSGLAVKLDHVKSAFAGGRGAALLALSTPVDGETETARARLREAAAALQPVKDRLARME
jgi:exosortase A